jgi:hypothetical protein
MLGFLFVAVAVKSDSSVINKAKFASVTIRLTFTYSGNIAALIVTGKVFTAFYPVAIAASIYYFKF